jgi:hypothetical protein
MLTQTGRQEVVPNPNAGWVAVAVTAPAGLAGRGAVIAIGTWQLTGKGSLSAARTDTPSLYERLLDWLSASP